MRHCQTLKGSAFIAAASVHLEADRHRLGPADEVGDHAGVGCMVDSCGVCVSCKDGHEQYCDKHETVYTYGSPDKHLGGITQGGYSKTVVVKEHFAIKIPKSMDLKLLHPYFVRALPPIRR